MESTIFSKSLKLFNLVLLF